MTIQSDKAAAATTTALQFATGFQIGRLSVTIEVFALRCWRIWGIERTDAASIACDLGIVSVMISKEGKAAANECSVKQTRA
jgi:hypothetical protein